MKTEEDKNDHIKIQDTNRIYAEHLLTDDIHSICQRALR